MMERSLYYIKWYFARRNRNTDKGKASNKKSIVKYSKWTLLASPMKELDDVMIKLQHGVLYREGIIADGADYCEYFILEDKEKLSDFQDKKF